MKKNDQTFFVSENFGWQSIFFLSKPSLIITVCTLYTNQSNQKRADYKETEIEIENGLPGM